MPKIQYNKLTVAGDFLAAAKSLTKRAGTIKADFQSAFVCALEFTAAHGDYESSLLVILDATKALGKNLHRAATEWVLAYSWLVEDDTSKSGFRKDQTKVINFDGAKSANWWETEKPPVGKPFDLQKAIQNLFDKATAAIDKGELSREVAEAAISAAIDKFSPDFVIDRVLDMSVDRQNELMTVMVARMTPAETPVLETAEAEAEAA